MSVCVRIRTGKILSPEEVFNALESNGNQILVTSNEWPNLKMGIIRKALRGIKINKEDNGYEIRLCTFGSFDDNLLFRNLIKLGCR